MRAAKFRDFTLAQLAAMLLSFGLGCYLTASAWGWKPDLPLLSEYQMLHLKSGRFSVTVRILKEGE